MGCGGDAELAGRNQHGGQLISMRLRSRLVRPLVTKVAARDFASERRYKGGGKTDVEGNYDGNFD